MWVCYELRMETNLNLEKIPLRTASSRLCVPTGLFSSRLPTPGYATQLPCHAWAGSPCFCFVFAQDPRRTNGQDPPHPFMCASDGQTAPHKNKETTQLLFAFNKSPICHPQSMQSSSHVCFWGVSVHLSFWKCWRSCGSMEVLKIWLSFCIDDHCLSCSLPNVWELPHQDPHLHLDGGDVFQEDDLREVWDSTV